MAKKIFKEEQKYHDYGVIGLVGILTLALLWRIGSSVFDTGPVQWTVIVPLLLVFGIVWLILLSLRLKIKISKNHLILGLNPFLYPKMKLPWEAIKSVAFFQYSEVALLSGHAVHFSSMGTHFGLGDKSGMQICTHDGQEYAIYSASLYENREAIMQALLQQYPTLDLTGCATD